MSAAPLAAQVTSPDESRVIVPRDSITLDPSRTDSASSSNRPVTASEYAYGIYRYSSQTMRGVPVTEAVPDTIRNAIQTRAADWARTLQSAPVPGIQLDPLGQLFVAAGNERAAVAQFEARLATPGLTNTDRAYTLLTAMSLFAQYGNPERMALAYGYLNRLEALPVDEVGRWQFTAYANFAALFFKYARSDSVRAYAHKAYAIAPRVPLVDRAYVVRHGLYLMYADALAGMKGGRERLDSLNAQILALATLSPALIARDSAYAALSNDWIRDVKKDFELTANLGTRAASLVAHRWYNTTIAPSAAFTPDTVRMNDGTIRLIEFGDRGCQYCMLALPAMDKLHAELKGKGAEVLYVTTTVGFWGTKFAEPKDETERLREYYIGEKHYTLPIGIWAGEKQPTEDDGMLPAPSPNSGAYKVTGVPTFYLVDGNGFVRHISRGFARGEDQRLLERIQRLLQERTQ